MINQTWVSKLFFEEFSYHYTERQKKLLYHFFRANFTKIQRMKPNHIWIQLSYSAHYEFTSEQTKGCSYQNGKQCTKIAKGHKKKSQKLLTERAPRKAVYSEHTIDIQFQGGII